MASTVTPLPGEETLLACWSTLTQLSPGARLIRSSTAAVAVFPSWAPLNNAIMRNGHDRAAAAAAALELASVYADAGVDAWALWLPSRATDLDAPDDVRDLALMKRDTTTLVMQTTMPDGLQSRGEVVRASLAALTRIANDEPVPVTDLGEPEAVPQLMVWATMQDDVAVGCAYSYLHGSDCGIYAVGTLPQWRRRGLGRSLMEHVLADARRRGALTATLQSTRMAQPLYASLGFEPAGRYEEWVPR